MKKTGAGCRILCFILMILFVAVPVCATDIDTTDLSVSKGYHTIDAQRPMLSKSEDISNLYAAVLYDQTNDALIYADNPDQKFDPASLVKIMTALIIAEKGAMDDQVTVDGDLLSKLSSNSVGIGLVDGEIISMQDLLYAILVKSANDAAVVAADHISGSTEAFVQEMNSYAKELGCQNTNFTNVHGLYNEQQTSTARDITRILIEAVKNEVFIQAFSAMEYTIPATNLSEARELTTSNYMMSGESALVPRDRRVTGGRTGIMETGERNLAVTAEKNDLKLICVVLGSHSQLSADGYSVESYGAYGEARALLDLGYYGYQSIQVFRNDQVFDQFPIVNGDSYVSAGLKDTIQVLLPTGTTSEDIIYRYDDNTDALHAPVKTGDRITTVQAWYDDICLAQTDLYALHDVNVKETLNSDQLPDETPSSAKSVLVVVAVIVVIFILLLFGRRFIFRIIRSRQIRRHRKNRRRSS